MSLIIAGIHVFLVAKIRVFLIRCWAFAAQYRISVLLSGGCRRKFWAASAAQNLSHHVIFQRKITTVQSYIARQVLGGVSRPKFVPSRNFSKKNYYRALHTLPVK
jgi:hypothetical protein